MIKNINCSSIFKYTKSYSKRGLYLKKSDFVELKIFLSWFNTKLMLQTTNKLVFLLLTETFS